MDLSTTRYEDRSSALYQLENDRAYGQLKAVRSGEIYTTLPYNSYNQKYGSVLDNAYFAGKLLYPERFDDVEIEEKAVEIYTFLV